MKLNNVPSPRSAMPRTIGAILYDAFTDIPFAGNIAGVVLNSDSLSAKQMQAIANEMAAPTTGFVGAPIDGRAWIRYFTPTQEIPLCGHVTIAVCKALAEAGVAVRTLSTSVGPIEVHITNQAGRWFIQMDQPLPRFRETKIFHAQAADLLGISEGDMEDRLPVQLAWTGLWHLLLPVRLPSMMQRLVPDNAKLCELSRELGADTVGAFSLVGISDDGTLNIRLRDFCPAIGNTEEAASGTTNGALACFLATQGWATAQGERETSIINSVQGDETGRIGKIRTELTFQGAEIVGVRVGGTAIRTFSGEIVIP